MLQANVIFLLLLYFWEKLKLDASLGLVIACNTYGQQAQAYL